jgi:hypothetical protein
MRKKSGSPGNTGLSQGSGATVAKLAVGDIQIHDAKEHFSESRFSFV